MGANDHVPTTAGRGDASATALAAKEGQDTIALASILYHIVSPARRTVYFTSYRPLRTSGMFFFAIAESIDRYLMLAAYQLIRDIGITNGDETSVGYYVGLMVSLT